MKTRVDGCKGETIEKKWEEKLGGFGSWGGSNGWKFLRFVGWSMVVWWLEDLCIGCGKL